MNDRPLEHPERSVLVAFGLGKLPPAEVAAVESHIAECPACCETLQSLVDDTFIELVQQAGALEIGSMTGVAEVTAQTAPFPVDSAEPARDVPSELANHPRYRILRQLGQGGMGVVFAAEHRLMNRLVALKVIRPNLINRPDAIARFRREVRAAARLAHPNIVTAYDAEQAGELHFLVMEYVDGTPLSQIVERDGPLPVWVACDYVRQMADALQHAHRFAMVHRDIKPHNVMVEPNGRIKILDFGIATLADPSPIVAGDLEETGVGEAAGGSDAPRAAHGSQNWTGPLTEMGTVMGTPDFVAPEQIANARSADIRADIYSLGCTLYYLLAAQPPFPDGTAQDKLRAHATEAPRSLSELNRDVSPELEAVVIRMMAKKAADRYRTPAELATALKPFSQAPMSQLGQGDAALRRLMLGTLSTAALLCAVAAAVIYVKTDHGTLEIETSEPDVQLVLSQGGHQVKVIDVQTGSSVEWLRSGRYNVELRGGDDLKLTMMHQSRGANDAEESFDPVRDGFTLSRGDCVIARVERKPNRQAAISAPRSPSGLTNRPVGEARDNSSGAAANAIRVLLEGSDGVEMRGDVDTARNTFTITSWTDAGGKTWTPRASQMPLTLAAVAKDGRTHDVPPDWDGNLLGFAFQLPAGEDVTDIAWNEDRPADFMRGASFGWGGLRNSAGRIVLRGTYRFPYVPSDVDKFRDINLTRITVERTLASGQRFSNVLAAPRRGRPKPPPGMPGDSRIRLNVQPTGVIPIALHNAGFEDPPLPDGRFVTDKIPHWNVVTAGAAAAGVHNPRNEDFAGATDGGDATTLAEGRNVAFCRGSSSADRAILSQVLPVRLEPNTEYIVNVAIGRQATGDWPGYQVQLRAGSELLAMDHNSLAPPRGKFETSIVKFATETDDARIGQPLEVRLLGGANDQAKDAQMQFDRVQVYSRPAIHPPGRPSTTLTWSEVPGNRGYIVERGEAWRTGPFLPVATLDGDITSYVDDDPTLRPGATYYYRVRSRGSHSVRSSPTAVTTLTANQVVEE